MDANQLLIIDIQGSAGIVLEDGSIKALSLGDTITVGDIVITAANSSLLIDVKGISLAIPANQRVQITPDLVAETTRDSSETTIFDDSIDDAIASLNQPNSADEASSSPLNEDVSDFLSALESGGDLLDTLEATAAGGNAATGSGGGTSFVELARIAEGIDPSSLSFDDSFTANNDDIFSLRDTTDGVVPETALIGSLTLNDIGLINNPQPVISGTSTNLVGETVLITITDALDNVQTIAVIVQPDGTFTSPAIEPLPDGPIVVDVTVIGPDGEPVSDTITADIDTTAPVISIATLTDSASPVVTITGSVVGLDAGDDVTLTVTDSAGQVQTFVTQVDQQGNWSITTAALAEGPYNVQANAVDAAGNEGNAEATAVIDLTAPVIAIDAIADTNDTTPTLTGSANGVATGTLVSITVVASNGATQTLTATVTADGSWSAEVTDPLVEGEFTVTATVADSAGNTASDSEVGVVDITAPTITINTLGESNDTTPTISGTTLGVNAGTTVTLVITDSNGDQQTIIAVTDAAGNWQVDPSIALAEGDYTVTASVSDEAGNQASDTSVGLIDVTAPLISLDTLANSADDTPTISGQVQGVASGTLVSIVVVDANGAQQIFTTQTLIDGSFAVEVPSSLAQGQYSVVATVVDTAGNQASDSTTGLIDLSLLSITINIVGETNDTTPELTGSTLNAAAGDQVQVVITDINGQTETLVTTVDANGNWTVTPSQDLAEGEFSVTAVVTDSFGNTANAAITGIVDITAPTIIIDTVGDINDSTPVIAGSTQGASLGSIVSIVVTDSQNNSQTYTASTDANGNWSFDVTTPVAAGEFTVTASVTDAAGNTGTDTEIGTFNNTSPVLTLDFDQLTSDNTPLISGTSDTDAGSVVTVLVTDSSGNTQTLLAVVGADGSWSISPDNALPDGNFTVTASVADTFGNQSTVSDSGVIDATAPTLTIDNLGTVNDTTPIISGQTNEPAGSVVNLVVNDGVTSQNLTAIVNGDGSWSVEVPNVLQNGTIDVIANITDAAGNQATASSSFILNDNAPSISIDTIDDSNDVTPMISGTSDAPDGAIITVIITDSNNNSQTLTTTVTAGIWSVEAQNTVAEGEYTVDASVTVDGLTSEAQATGIIDTQAPTVDINPLADSNDSTPSITGSSDEIGGIVSVIVTDANGDVQSLTATVLADGTWSVDVPTPLAEGAFVVDASVTDAAGNTASDTENGGVIDTQAPTVDIDPLADGNDSTPTITGSSDEIGGLVSITVTDANGDIQTLTATVLADGSWSVDVPTPLAEGAFQVDASVTDAAGNTAFDTENGGVIDTLAPTVDIDPLADSNDSTPTISGSSDEIGGLVSITVTDANGDVQTLTATVLADGTWSVDVPTPLAEGAFQVDASVTDAAGNTASDTENGGVIDTLAPIFDIDPLAATNDTTPTITGSSDEIGGLVSITVTDANGDIQSLMATVLADGTWSVDVPTPLAEGAFIVDASVTDAAGNTASDTENGGVIDTQAPIFDIDPLADSNDSTPTITGSSDEIGGLVSITVTDANGDVQTLTATVLADGTWSVDVPTPLAEGAFVVDASVIDAAGNTASDTENGGVIDTLAPIFDIDPLAATNDSTPTITGSSDEIGGLVSVIVTDANGDIQSLTATVLADGTWSVDVPTSLAEGAFVVDASVTDAAGNTASDTENGGVIDTLAPTFDIDPLAATNDSTPTITGSSDEIGGLVSITVTDANGDIQTLTATVLADGSWSVDVPTPLAEG
ncbi:MAG TPA: retention module-containing protein, partial [Pseudoalteromonas prydzensis]